MCSCEENIEHYVISVLGLLELCIPFGVLPQSGRNVFYLKIFFKDSDFIHSVILIFVLHKRL